MASQHGGAVGIWADGLSVHTTGLRAVGQAELSASVRYPHLVEGACEFLRFTIAYLLAEDRRIRSGETMRYGYWIVRFQGGVDGRLEAWEEDPGCTEWCPGVSTAVTYWGVQQAACARHGASFEAPLAHDLAAITEGVLEGDLPVQGVRYPPGENLCGWWFSTDRYQGDIETVRPTHLYHVTSHRLDLAPYLALPVGFRVQLLDEGMAVWFDEDVAAGE